MQFYPRSGWLWGVCFACALAVGLGCSSKEARYPQDYARYQRIDAALEALQKGYNEKNPGAIAGLMLPLEPLDQMQTEIHKDFETYAEIKVEFSVERIAIEGNTIETYVHWQGQWKKASADDGIRERGHGILRWIGVQSILLSSTEGDMPFGVASHQAKEAESMPLKPSAP
jgi:hypothetical protein